MEINDIAVRLDRVVKTYGDAVTGVRAVDGVSLTLPVGSFTAIMGPSGSGKSTLVQCAAGLLPVDDGEVTVGGARITGLNDRRLTRWRRQHVGFVFQGYNLVPYLTAAENVALPMRLARGRVDRAAVADALARVGLADRADHLPAELSGGQAQRVAVARALVTRPAVVLADEPTGALDTVSAREVLTLLRDSVDQLGQTVVMVTHDPVAASHADEVVYLVDGRVVGTMRNPSADAVASQLAHLDDLVTTGAHR